MTKLTRYIKGPPLLLGLFIIGFALLTQYDCQLKVYKTQRQQQLEDAIKQQVMTEDPQTRYVVKWFDLNQDQEKEAIVHVMSPDLCHQQECHSYIFQWNASEHIFQQIGQNKMASPPIIAVPEQHQNWYAIRLHQAGNQLMEYHFNGKRYVQAKQVQVNHLVEDTPYGAQLISMKSLEDQSIALFDDAPH